MRQIQNFNGTLMCKYKELTNILLLQSAKTIYNFQIVNRKG